jgi:ParB family chromosome partitioning protein
MSTNTQNAPRSVLGKGLASLLPPTQNRPVTEPVKVEPNKAEQQKIEPPESNLLSKDRVQGISMLSIDQIKANEYQPRRDFDATTLEELAQSIRENGLIQPLVVRKNGDQYELIAGERRLRASKLAGVKVVPVVIRKSTDREALELAIVENIQRVDLNCVDEALAFFQLMQEFNLSQEELAKKMGKDRATVANSLRILKLSDSILGELKKGTLSRGHAKALLSVEEAPTRDKLANEIIQQNLSVRQAEKAAQDVKAGINNGSFTGSSATKENVKKADSRNAPELMRFNQALTNRFMTRAEIKGDIKSGHIQLQYGSTEELYRILNIMLGE